MERRGFAPAFSLVGRMRFTRRLRSLILGLDPRINSPKLTAIRHRPARNLSFSRAMSASLQSVTSVTAIHGSM